jgi:hypothetical protein
MTQLNSPIPGLNEVQWLLKKHVNDLMEMSRVHGPITQYVQIWPLFFLFQSPPFHQQ